MNFERIDQGVDVAPLLAAINLQPDLWDEITIRQTYPGSAHHDTSCIFLRGPYAFTFAEYMGNTKAYDYPVMDALMPVIHNVMRPILIDLGVTELGYVLVVRLKAGGEIDPHIDEGAYADHYERFHLVLTSEPGNEFTVADQTVHMAPGDLWWFNHKRLHSVVNGSAHERIHVIFDAVRARQ